MDPRHQLFAHEIVQDLTGETYLLGQSIRRNRPDLDFAFVIGMDNANFFEKWHENKKLAEEFPFIVMAREGVEPDPKVDWYRKGHHLYSDVVKPMPPIGSRDIRSLIAAKDYAAARQYLDPAVMDYIICNGLYATKA